MSILRHIWPRRRASADRITVGVHVVTVPKPIPLAERGAGPGDDLDDLIWWGYRYFDTRLWDLRLHPEDCHTHWLPATVEILPARCCVPEVE